MEDRWQVSAARARMQRVRADPVLKSARAVGLVQAGRWAEAALAFEEFLQCAGPASESAAAAFFWLGLCRLEVDDHRGALEASTLYVELSDEGHAFFREGVHNLAAAASRLGHYDAAIHLFRSVLGMGPNARALAALALTFIAAGRVHEARYALDEAARLGLCDPFLDAAAADLPGGDAVHPRPTWLRAPQSTREQVLSAAFGMLGWTRAALPRTLIAEVRDGAPAAS